MNTIHDPEFGPITFDDFDWVLKQPALFNGIEIPIHIQPENDDPFEISPVQRQALSDILSLPNDVLEKSAPAVMQNYEIYREMIGDEEMPPLALPTDVWKLVQPTYMRVEPHDDIIIPTFFLWAECDWDVEHGLMVRFKHGYADAASQQGDLDLTD